ncbi:type III-A CRISPR-associated protein Cas10/Csm1 [Desulfotomaculum copahuensis]|uniref:type III-A CRISPR-associated protein Cas10/Csm1 n=1 Tax=Desulfotomaculum copahuensis TaxID=1838280 RepID=UPI000A6C9601|nr:type III-A CRISPR-associated protein Cas10/Csm1 [Desulfotomaculum copahuensis]
MEFSDVIKGALLHDVGKFIQRTGNEQRKTHQEIGAAWLKERGVPETVAVFAARHHGLLQQDLRREMVDAFAPPVNELVIVYEADNLSSGERPEKKGEGKWEHAVPLMSVFSKISLKHRAGQPVFNQCWSFHALAAGGEKLNFPGSYDAVRAGYGPDGYGRLLTPFTRDFEKIAPALPVDSLLMLLEKYTAGIPSETRVVEGKPESLPDVSLFDHLKTTAAIAACLYRYYEETRPEFREACIKEKILDRRDRRYMLVGGDFSGVQKFIYTISSKGALKTLRARSFFLELLTEHVISRLLNRMKLPRTNIIYSGGARFYLLAPATTGCRAALEELEAQINTYLYNTYRGRLYLALDKIEFAGNAFLPGNEGRRDIAGLWQDLAEGLREKKNRKFIGQIAGDPDGFWSPAGPEEKVCAVCHDEVSTTLPLTVFDDHEPVEVCPVCRRLYELGDELPGTKFIAACEKRLERASCVQIEDTYYAFYPAGKSFTPPPCRLLYVLNSWSIDDYLLPRAAQLFTADYAARQGRAYKGFDMLAEEAAGAERIGILRMDVDNLGHVFTCGLPGHERTFSRLSTLSRELTRFFKFHLNEICRGAGEGFQPFRLLPGRGERNVTVVYAGGDDLFVAGSWDQVVELAFDINFCFRRYTGRNPHLTISGGMVVHDAKHPLYRLAEMAGEAEERAKDNGRDSIALFYSTVPDFTADDRPLFTGTYKWSEAGRLVDEILKPAVSGLAEVKDGGKRVQFMFSKGFLHRLAAVTDIWRREGRLYLPRLAYILAREGEHNGLKNNRTWQEWKKRIYHTELIGCLRTAITWMELLSRRGTE